MSKNGLDDTDRALVALLRRSARAPTSEIARKLGVARSTVQARIDRLERDGVIGGYTIIPGAAVRSGGVRASVLLQIEPRAAASVVAALSRLRAVESIITTAGRFDLTVRIAAEDTSSLDQALDRIGVTEGVRGMESLIHLTVKLDRRL